MADDAQVRHDELAEIKLRILDKLHRAYPNGAPIRPDEVLRPGARHTGPDDVAEVLEELRGNWIQGGVIVDLDSPGDGVTNDDSGDFELTDVARHLLDRPGSRKGKTWIEAAREIIGKPVPDETEADAFWGKLWDDL